MENKREGEREEELGKGKERQNAVICCSPVVFHLGVEQRNGVGGIHVYYIVWGIIWYINCGLHTSPCHVSGLLPVYKCI